MNWGALMRGDPASIREFLFVDYRMARKSLRSERALAPRPS